MISEEKLDWFADLCLAHGQHPSPEEGACAMEAVSFLSGEGFTDAPRCVSPVLIRYVIRLNDRWDSEKRQALKPYLIRMIGTGGDGKDAVRAEIALRHTAELLSDWLELAGLDSTRVRSAKSDAELYKALVEARERAQGLRLRGLKTLKARILERLRGTHSTSAVDGAVAALADTYADAADTVTVAVADAAAAASNADAAAAVTVAAAVADAAAVAAAVAATVSNPLPVAPRIAALSAEHDAQSLTLLGSLIDAQDGELK